MPKVLRRKKSLTVVNKDGITISEICCRKCMIPKSPKEFFQAVDHYLDKNGFMSLCKECISEIYAGQYNVEHDFRKAIYNTCRIVNVLYSESAVQATESQMKNKEILPDDKSVFGWYKAKIASTMKGFGAAKMGESVGADFTFKYENSNIPERNETIDFEGSGDVIAFWGGEKQFSIEDYRYLEQEFANFKHTHKCDTYAETVLLKEVCYKLLEIKKARESSHPTAAGIKELQEIMKNLAISPNMVNQASAGKSMECFGKWIEEIEQFKPAEYFADKSIYKDVENIEEYGEKYITAPLKAFILQSADYSTEELEKMLDDEASTEG